MGAKHVEWARKIASVAQIGLEYAADPYDRERYEELAANRKYFGEFDPFGDFDLLFGARKLNFKIMDVPVRYQERVYGATNIRRWRHGVILLGMCMFAARKLRFV